MECLTIVCQIIHAKSGIEHFIPISNVNDVFEATGFVKKVPFVKDFLNRLVTFFNKYEPSKGVLHTPIGILLKSSWPVCVA